MTASTQTLNSVTLALVAVATGVDKAIAKAADAKSAWAAFCAAGLVGDKPSLTLDAIGEAMLEACRAKCSTVRQRKQLERVSHLAKHGFSTAYGWLMDLRRVHEAGLTVLMLASETGNGGKPYSLTELRRGTDPRQPKAKGRTGKAITPKADAEPTPNATAPVAPADGLTLETVAAFLEAEAKRRSAKSLADNDQAALGRITAATATMVRMVEAHIKAKADKAKAKPAKAKRVRKAA
jgi:hypothetical protein